MMSHDNSRFAFFSTSFFADRHFHVTSNQSRRKQKATIFISPLQAAACGSMVVIKLLQKAGGRVNVRNTAGMTPLAYAASRGQAQLVSTLISMGCPVDTRNKDGTTPLHQAATAGNQVQLQMQDVLFTIPSSHSLLFFVLCYALIKHVSSARARCIQP